MFREQTKRLLWTGLAAILVVDVIFGANPSAQDYNDMKKLIISTTQAPAAIGPYSQAVEVGDFLFLSGQIPLDAEGKRVQGDIVVQTIQVLENLKAVLGAAGLSLNQVVKTTVFLTDMSDFAEMNRVYAEFFPERCPARTTVQVVSLPRGVAIEIEAIACKK